MADEYISREAVMQKFADHVKRSNNSDFAQTPTWNQAVQIVEDYPAADVAPVRHGRWIKADSNPLHGDFFCSDCQHGVDIGDGEETPIDRGFYYCHNCGCAMEDIQ